MARIHLDSVRHSIAATGAMTCIVCIAVLYRSISHTECPDLFRLTIKEARQVPSRTSTHGVVNNGTTVFSE